MRKVIVETRIEADPEDRGMLELIAPAWACDIPQASIRFRSEYP